jgi:HSP20 family protein
MLGERAYRFHSEGEIPMSILVRKENDNKYAPLEGLPGQVRVMRDLMNWDPFREMSAYGAPITSGFIPCFEVKETKDGYLFRADVPGVREADLDITVTRNRLTVSGKREADKEEAADTFYAYERSYGSFTRSFTLPEGVDASGVHADLRDGVLTLVVKKTLEAQPKKIPIQSAGKRS